MSKKEPTSTPGVFKITWDDGQVRYRAIVDAGPGPDPKNPTKWLRRRQVCITRRTLKEVRAEKSRIEAKREARETVFLPNRDLTVARALDEWLASRKKIDEQCRYNYASAVRLLQAHWPGQQVAALTVPMVEALIADMESGKARRIGKGPMAPRTIRLVVGVLAMTYDRLVRQQQVQVNPVRWAELPEMPKRHDRAWTADQTTRFLRTVRSTAPELYAGFLLSTFGMRPSEVLRLTWAHVTLGTGTLRIVQSKTEAGVRELPLPQLVVDALRAERKRQAEQRLASPVWDERGLVVCDEIGRPVRIANYRQRFKELAAVAGNPAIRLYDLRHGTATLFAALGVYPEVRAAWLGHSNSSITLTSYTDTAGVQQLRDAGDRLAALLDANM